MMRLLLVLLLLLYLPPLPLLLVLVRVGRLPGWFRSRSPSSSRCSVSFCPRLRFLSNRRCLWFLRPCGGEAVGVGVVGVRGGSRFEFGCFVSPNVVVVVVVLCVRRVLSLPHDGTTTIGARLVFVLVVGSCSCSSADGGSGSGSSATTTGGDGDGASVGLVEDGVMRTLRANVCSLASLPLPLSQSLSAFFRRLDSDDKSFRVPGEHDLE
mmetsp:Transcript_18285/g.38104  ORF Transcript_18285/g.38104 Transcript_18285/m.38104 type:complete len:210 (-) Transcript_18285:59-688(-)